MGSLSNNQVTVSRPRDNTPGCATQCPKSRRPTTAVTESKKLWEKNLWELFDRPIAIDPDGRIEEVYGKVKPESHAADILADLPDKGPE